MKFKPKFNAICAPYIYGYEATNGNRKAEVIRHYASHWEVYRFVDGKQLSVPLADTFEYGSMQSARKAAKLWLLGKRA